MLLSLFSGLLLSCTAMAAATPSLGETTNIMAKDVETRNIMMKATNGTVHVKYKNVPNTYTDAMVKHADLVGMHFEFNNKEIWLTLDDKRLFQFATEDATDPNTNPQPEAPSEFPIMSPDELKTALETYAPQEDLHAKWMKVSSKSNNTLEQRDFSSCWSTSCSGHPDCWPSGDATGTCTTCRSRSCTWIATPAPPVTVNAIYLPGSG